MLRVEPLESRDNPGGLAGWTFEPQVIATFGADYRDALLLHEGEARFAVAGGEGAGPRVTLLDDAGTEIRNAAVPGYAEDYRGGLNLRSAGDRIYVTPAAPGSGAVVAVLDADTLEPVGGPYFAMAGDADYRGGLRVAVWDLTRDGSPELIALGDTGDGRTRVCVLDAATGAGKYSWYAPAGARFAPTSLGVDVDTDRTKPGGFSLEFRAGLQLSAYDPVPTTTYRIDGTVSDLYDLP